MKTTVTNKKGWRKMIENYIIHENYSNNYRNDNSHRNDMEVIKRQKST